MLIIQIDAKNFELHIHHHKLNNIKLSFFACHKEQSFLNAI